MEQQIDIKKLRERLAQSQDGFARMLGVNQSTISLWESRKAEPRGPAKLLLKQLWDESPQEPAQ